MSPVVTSPFRRFDSEGAQRRGADAGDGEELSLRVLEVRCRLLVRSLVERVRGRVIRVHRDEPADGDTVVLEREVTFLRIGASSEAVNFFAAGAPAAARFFVAIIAGYMGLIACGIVRRLARV